LPAFGDATAIGRITPNGEVATFNRCLHHGPPYTGPSSLVAGPDGNIWFTSTTTRSLPNVGTPPAIGRITPSGEITEFRAGLNYASTPDGIIVAPDGALWFTDRELGKIGRLLPSAAPANTFLVGAARRVKRNGLTKLTIIAPSSGLFSVEQVGLISARNRLTRLAAGQTSSATATATACGRANLRLALKGAGPEATAPPPLHHPESEGHLYAGRRLAPFGIRAGRDGASAPVGDAAPGGLSGKLDQLVAAIGLDVAEGLGVLVEDDVQLALLDPLIEPGAAED
jgi:hypothetical protein